MTDAVEAKTCGARASTTCGIRGRPTLAWVETWCGENVLNARVASGEVKVSTDIRDVTCDGCQASLVTDGVVSGWGVNGEITLPNGAVLWHGDDKPTFPVVRDDEGKPAVEKLMDECFEKPDSLKLEIEKAKIEDGDLVLVQFQHHFPSGYLEAYRKALTKFIREDMGIDARVVVMEPGTTISVVKKAELGDLHQRIEDLEDRIDQLRHEVLG